MREKRFGLFLMVAVLSVFSFGCSIIESHSTERVVGLEIDAKALSQLELGETTRSEAIRLLGPPSSARLSGNGEEHLSYTVTRTTNRHGHLLFVIDTSSKVERKETLSLKFKDDILYEYKRGRS